MDASPRRSMHAPLPRPPAPVEYRCMPDAPPRLVLRHIALGAAARGAGVAAGAARLASLPLRPLARGAAAVPPVGQYAMALARTGSEVERGLLDRGDRLARDAVGSQVADELVDRLAAS